MFRVNIMSTLLIVALCFGQIVSQLHVIGHFGDQNPHALHLTHEGHSGDADHDHHSHQTHLGRADTERVGSSGSIVDVLFGESAGDGNEHTDTDCLIYHVYSGSDNLRQCERVSVSLAHAQSVINVSNFQVVTRYRESLIRIRAPPAVS